MAKHDYDAIEISYVAYATFVLILPVSGAA